MCPYIGERKFKRSKKQMKDLHESSKEKKTDKNLKTDDVSKSRGLKSRKTRVQKPKNKYIENLKQNKYAYKNPLKNITRKEEKKRRLVYIRK